MVVAGERRLMELFETPLSAKESSGPADDGAADNIGETAGMALDRTASEELQSELKRHIEAHAEVANTDQKILLPLDIFLVRW